MNQETKPDFTAEMFAMVKVPMILPTAEEARNYLPGRDKLIGDYLTDIRAREQAGTLTDQEKQRLRLMMHVIKQIRSGMEFGNSWSISGFPEGSATNDAANFVANQLKAAGYNAKVNWKPGEAEMIPYQIEVLCDLPNKYTGTNPYPPKPIDARS